MKARELVDEIAKIRPQSSSEELLRLALIMANQHADLNEFRQPERLEEKLAEISIQMSASADQHAAVTGELDSLASASPCEYSQAHLWTLAKALKVQSQILQLYV